MEDLNFQFNEAIQPGMAQFSEDAFERDVLSGVYDEVNFWQDQGQGSIEDSTYSNLAEWSNQDSMMACPHTLQAQDTMFASPEDPSKFSYISTRNGINGFHNAVPYGDSFTAGDFNAPSRPTKRRRISAQGFDNSSQVAQYAPQLQLNAALLYDVPRSAFDFRPLQTMATSMPGNMSTPDMSWFLSDETIPDDIFAAGNYLDFNNSGSMGLFQGAPVAFESTPSQNTVFHRDHEAPQDQLLMQNTSSANIKPASSAVPTPGKLPWDIINDPPPPPALAGSLVKIWQSGGCGDKIRVPLDCRLSLPELARYTGSRAFSSPQAAMRAMRNGVVPRTLVNMELAHLNGNHTPDEERKAINRFKKRNGLAGKMFYNVQVWDVKLARADGPETDSTANSWRTRNWYNHEPRPPPQSTYKDAKLKDLYEPIGGRAGLLSGVDRGMFTRILEFAIDHPELDLDTSHYEWIKQRLPQEAEPILPAGFAHFDEEAASRYTY